jgi:hypothetical protein
VSAAETMREQGFDASPRGQAKRWKFELEAADKEVKSWMDSGEKIVRRFRDDRDSSQDGQTRWNLFTSSVQTRRDMMYGKTPQVSVSRRFADSADDAARVASEMMQRALNADIERDGDGFRSALRHALCDRQLPGLGCARIRYVVEFEDVPEVPEKKRRGKVLAPPVPATQKKSWEDVETDYVHWKDFRWSAGARTWREVRWVAFAVEMSRKQLVEKYGEDGEAVPLDSRNSDGTVSKKETPWARARVWEIWSKEDGKVYRVAKSHNTVLIPEGLESGTEPGQIDEDGGQVDPYELDGFFPCPEPMLANSTTDTLVPRPDYSLVQDLYNEIDLVSTDISNLEKQVRVIGIYDKEAAPELSKMLSGIGNKMIPASTFAKLAEKGGLKGVVDWFPLEQVVNAILQMRDYRRELIDAVYQVSGDSDIMRGQATDANETATAQGLKAKFGSVRMQARQGEFAQFASDVQKLRAQLMLKRCDPKLLVERSNMQATPDAKFIPAALQLLQSQQAQFRIEVKPEAVAMADFAQLKSERTDIVGAIAQFFVAAQPIAQAIPGSMPFLLEILQWLVAGLRDGSAVEAILDRAIAAAEQLAKNPPQQGQAPDPKLLVQQMKGQQDMEKIAAERDADVVRAQVDVQAERAKQQAQTEENVKEHALKTQITNAMRPPAPAPAPAPTKGGPRL